MATRLLVWIFGLFLLVFVGTAFGEGKYQRTKDGDTIVWNENPKLGDTATWAGQRDAEGYATKTGTLTWYTARGTVYGRFVGNMVHGKLDGPVNGYSRGKTAHAVFIHGQRTTRWAAGTMPSFRSAPTEPVRPTAKIAKADNISSPAAPRVEQGSSTLIPPQTSEPIEKQMVRSVPPRDRPGFQKISPPQSETVRQQASSPRAQDLAATKPPPQPLPVTTEIGFPGTDHKHDIPEAPAEGPQPIATAPSPDAPDAPSGEGSRDRNPEGSGNEETQRPTEPAVAAESQEPAPNLPGKGESKNDVDVAVPTLMQPATSSREISDRAALSPVRPHLTAEEVIRIANAEARRRGYNWADYQKEEPMINADHKSWSVLYEQTTPDGMASASKRFTVIVDDKTKGAIVVPRE